MTSQRLRFDLAVFSQGSIYVKIDKCIAEHVSSPQLSIIVRLSLDVTYRVKNAYEPFEYLQSLIQRCRSLNGIYHARTLYSEPSCRLDSSDHDVKLTFDVFIYQPVTGRPHGLA